MPIGMRIVITHSMPIGTSSQCCSAVSFLNIRELVMPNILSINTTAIAHFGHQRKPICFNHSSGTATANFHPFHPGALGIHQTCTVFHIGALTASHSSSTHIHTYTKTFATKVITMLQDLQHHCSTFAGLPIGAMSSSAPSSKPSTKAAAGGRRTGLVLKRLPKEKGAQSILEERELRNTRAKTNMLLKAEEVRQQKAAAADEWEAPGTAFRLLEPAKAEELEYGEWGTEHWEPPGATDVEVHEEEQDEGDAQPEEHDDAKEEEEGDREEGDREEDDQEEDDEEKDDEENDDGQEPADDAEGSDQAGGKAKGRPGKGKTKKGGKKGGGGGGRKPWWARYGANAKGSGSTGSKGQGKGKFDDWGGEYCHGGYRAVNGQFFPQLDCDFSGCQGN